MFHGDGTAPCFDCYRPAHVLIVGTKNQHFVFQSPRYTHIYTYIYVYHDTHQKDAISHFFIFLPGGLGKVPGFYYVQQNRENLNRLRRELRTAVNNAMQATPQTLAEMSRRAMESSFPLVEWQAGWDGNHGIYMDLYGFITFHHMKIGI